MRKSLSFIAILVMSLLTFSVFAQQRPISGKVTSAEDNNALPGVTVVVKGTNRSTTTDANGNFTISARTGDVLQFSFVGRSPGEFTVRNNNSISVQLSSHENVLNEVVVAMDLKRNPRELGYSADPDVVPASPSALTLSQIMLQKYIALYGWGTHQTWIDMRKYHYIDNDPNTGFQVYAGFTPPPTSPINYLISTNNGKYVYRARPRFNSEYLYDIPELTRIGALDLDYITKEM